MPHQQQQPCTGDCVLEKVMGEGMCKEEFVVSPLDNFSPSVCALQHLNPPSPYHTRLHPLSFTHSCATRRRLTPASMLPMATALKKMPACRW
jgi:hypothetical protein